MNRLTVLGALQPRYELTWCADKLRRISVGLIRDFMCWMKLNYMYPVFTEFTEKNSSFIKVQKEIPVKGNFKFWASIFQRLVAMPHNQCHNEMRTYTNK